MRHQEPPNPNLDDIIINYQKSDEDHLRNHLPPPRAGPRLTPAPPLTDLAITSSTLLRQLPQTTIAQNLH